ncbi:uncharacterized protein (UPF0548 family) [Kribbella aluminosa]|uniref:Uncharacterized protein (UPF0548 family) n=1 Tax=Kribbella aluminosa TaxID=416017 RepID=A0ABS4UTV6_9ACTN|nr:DUF1990 domain-containing protein [Kribbella aluminosa]MBP2355078.1 uncharacterized protein (UPF0548 family) [Kribbella aluminosa]
MHAVRRDAGGLPPAHHLESAPTPSGYWGQGSSASDSEAGWAFLSPVASVWTVNEPDRIGFAYGTLQGHPESGEESFLVARAADGVYVAIRAYSRPASWYTRLAGPVTRKAQYCAATRYAAALRRLSA